MQEVYKLLKLLSDKKASSKVLVKRLDIVVDLLLSILPLLVINVKERLLVSELVTCYSRDT